MLVNHLSYGISQQNDILVKRFYLTLKLDAVNEVDRNRNVLPAQCVKKRVLQELAFIAHDILRVQKLLLEPHLTTWDSPDPTSTLESPHEATCKSQI